MAQPLVVRDLSFRYRSRDDFALRDVSFAQLWIPDWALALVWAG